MSETVQADASAPMHDVAVQVANAVLATKNAVAQAGFQAPLLAKAEALAAALETERAAVVDGQREPEDWLDGAKQAIESVQLTLATLSQKSLPQPQIDAMLTQAKATLAAVEAKLVPKSSSLLFVLGTVAVGGLGWWAYHSMSKAAAESHSMQGDDDEEFDLDPEDGIERVSPSRKSKKAKNAPDDDDSDDGEED